jgi:hypothetical protein
MTFEKADPATGLSSLYLFGTPVLTVLKGADVRLLLAKSDFRESVWLMQHHMAAMLGEKVGSWLCAFAKAVSID